jgi:hypothetical protein
MPRIEGKTASNALKAGNNSGMLYLKEEKRTLDVLRTPGKNVVERKQAVNDWALASLKLRIAEGKPGGGVLR